MIIKRDNVEVVIIGKISVDLPSLKTLTINWVGGSLYLKFNTQKACDIINRRLTFADLDSVIDIDKIFEKNFIEEKIKKWEIEKTLC